ncbi:MAG: cobyric acid synthase [Nitrosopumilus sp. H8]|nr:MAG: cobyric acid synthase [Nitrosopumilus sp. H13]RNJ80162.1 MAG: cobyric acid synthase [Nitrosopumilus sp. H8]
MRALMVQGTSSGAGKTVLVAALCRIFSDMGYDVAPFKSQNMSNFAYKGKGFEISRAQAIQALAARCEITPDLNPVLLKPLGEDTSAVYVGGRYRKKMRARDYYEFAGSLLEEISGAMSRLDHDLLIIEGAGSPAEINLQRYDIANMRIAEMARAPVLLVSDIERGGSFASLTGTMSLIEKKYQKMVRGFVLNKFRGDPGILEPGIRKLRRITKIPVLGVIPMIKINLPEEDSLGAGHATWNGRHTPKIDREIDRLAETARENLDMKKIEAMI